jgi:hypothetical protein
MKSKIENFEKVVQATGFETRFHDGEVLSIELSRVQQEPSLTICILTPRSFRPTEKAPSDPLYHVVRIKFHEIDDLEIRGFNYQNVVQELVETEAEGRLKFWVAGVFGVDCSFTCEKAKVLSVEQTALELSKPFRRDGSSDT